MNIVYNKQLLLTISTFFFAIVLSSLVNLFLKQTPLELINLPVKPLAYELDIVSKSSLKSKNIEDNSTEKKVIEVVLLKEFILKGTITGSINAAIISHKGKGEYVYLSETYEGYKLKEVLNDKVIFERNGKEYTLYLYEALQEVTPNPTSQNSSKSQTKRVIIKSPELFTQIKQKENNYFIPRILIKEYLNLETIFSQISVVGIFNNNSFTGFLIQKVHPQGIFAKLGLKRGDRIMKINGNSFKSMNEPFVYFNGIDKLSSLSLTIIRNGKEEELKYEIY